MNSYVAAVDAGTGGVRCVIFDIKGRAVSDDYREMHTRYTDGGRAEQDPRELVENAYAAVRGAIGKNNIDASAIRGISFTGPQTTFVPMDRRGNCLGNIILWQDMRGTQMFPWIREKLKENNLTEADLYKRTFRPLDAMMEGAKALWLRKYQPELYARIHKFAGPQTVLLRAFGADGYTNDRADGGWWLSHDTVTLKPDPELLRIFGFDPDLFPDLLDPATQVGEVTPQVAERTGLRTGTPLFQGVADQFCAALSAGNYGTPDIGALCLGTAGIAMIYSDEPIPDPMGSYYVLHYPTGGYVREVCAPVAASAFRWVRDMLYPAGAFNHDNIYAEMDGEAARAAIGSGGVAFLPQMVGSVYPRKDVNMRGGFIGMSLGTTRAELTRAALEGVCYEMREILDASNGRFDCMRLLGGAARSDLWNQMQANVYNCPVETISTEEASALGTAMVAATGAGIYPTLKHAVLAMSGVKKRYEPDPASVARYDESYRAWLKCAEDLSARAFPALADVRSKA